MKIKVLSYNIHKGFSTSGIDFTLHEMRDALREIKADLVLLQEVVGQNLKHQRQIKKWPSQAQFEFLADSVWDHYSYGKNAIYDGRDHGNAILSKFPIRFWENINISTNRFEQRGLLHAEIFFPESEKLVHVFNVHLNLLEGSRKSQIKRISERAMSHVPEGTSFILGGDFNDWTGKLHGLCNEYLGAFEAHDFIHKKLPKSFPSFYPSLPLDRLYFKHLKINQAQVLSGPPWNRLSDHLPLLVEFELT